MDEAAIGGQRARVPARCPLRGRRALLGAALLASVSAVTQADQNDPPAPELQVRVAFTPEVGRQRGWLGEFRCAAARASELLEVALGRRLHVREQVVWSGVGATEDLYELRSRLVRGVEHGGADLVVGLVRARDGGATPTIREDGLAAYSQGYVVLRIGGDLCGTGRLLAHEIAHVFGGIHREGGSHLMDPRTPGTAIDELNAALFALHRDRSIRDQAPPLRGESLRMMWRLARADLADPDTWERVGVLAATMGKLEPACDHYERALAIDPGRRGAWVNLGHARLQLGRFADAETAYDRALAIDPDDGLVHNNLAVIYLSTDRAAQALTAAERAQALDYEVSSALLEAIRARLQKPPISRSRSASSRARVRPAAGWSTGSSVATGPSR